MRTSGPSADVLRGWVAGSLRMTERAVAALPPSARSGDGPDVPAPPLDQEKVVGEALLLLRASARVVDGPPDPAWQRLYDDVAPLGRPDSLPALLCLDPARAVESAFAHIQLSALGNPDPELDLLLELADAEPACGPDPYVVAALHREWLQGVRTGGPDLARLAALVGGSSLGRPVDVLRCTTQDVYDLTHAVMHGTDLGAWPVSSPRPVADLVADLDALLGIALDADNLDLAAEVLWSWPMLRLPLTPSAVFALDVLAHAHDERGFLPGPGFQDLRHAAMSPGEADTYVLRTSYHATLVLGMLGASMLAAGQAEVRPGAVARPVVVGSAARLLEHIDHPPQRTWRGQLAAADADRLSRMLLAVALRRASDRPDLPRVRALLELALELDLADGHVVRQSVTLLRRGAALARRTIEPCAVTPKRFRGSGSLAR